MMMPNAAVNQSSNSNLNDLAATVMHDISANHSSNLPIDASVNQSSSLPELAAAIKRDASVNQSSNLPKLAAVIMRDASVNHSSSLPNDATVNHFSSPPDDATTMNQMMPHVAALNPPTIPSTINAIYGDGTLRPSEAEVGAYELSLDFFPTPLILSFPPDYAQEAATIRGPVSTGTSTPKQIATSFAERARGVLHETLTRNSETCLFDLIEGLRCHYEATSASPEERTPWQVCADTTKKEEAEIVDVQSGSMERAADPSWVVSDVMSEKKSVFVARACQISSVHEAHYYIQRLLASNKKVAKATHNIMAVRTRCSSIDDACAFSEEYDDDGKSAAGARLLHLLQLMEACNVLAVVTRWYGGIQLGPDRFRLINATAKDAITKARNMGIQFSK